MRKFLVWVNTYNRQKMLSRFIDDIHRYRGDNLVSLMVVDDASIESYESLSTSITYYHKMREHHGKENYWKLINFGFDFIRSRLDRFDIIIKTDDDVCLVPDFFNMISGYIDSINDQKWATIDILSAPKQRGKTLLGKPSEVWKTTHKYYKTQWVDMNFVINKKFFPDPILRCKGSPRSSGVGLWLTRYYNNLGLNMYQLPVSFVIHGNHPSQMNPEERKRNPLVTQGNL